MRWSGSGVMLWLLIGTTQAATPLENALTRYFQQQQEAYRQVSVSIISPPERLPACDAPAFSLPAANRRWGKINVVAQCPEKKSYLQVDVQVTGAYPVAKHAIERGQTLNAADFQLNTGRLDRLPTTTLYTIASLSDAVTLRPIAAGQVITRSMVRQEWKIKAGQTVPVAITGDGFNIRSEGKALNNATAAGSVRVRMPSGQIVNGKIDAQGVVNLAR